MDRKRVAAYCRVSTASDMQDGSYETQVDYYKQKIAQNPEMQLVEVYGDHGISGRSIKKRPGLQRLIKDCKAGKIDLILVKSVSRFARNMMECVKTIRELRVCGVVVAFEKEGFTTSSIQCELILSIMATIAEQESVSIGQNIAWSRSHRNQQGNPIENQPYGYDKVMPGHIWKINEREGLVVQTAFYMACNGYNYMDIMTELNRMEAEHGSKRVWKNTPVKYMLNNTSYTGDVLTNKNCSVVTPEGTKSVKNDGLVDQFYIEEHHEPLVSHAVFDIVQKLVERHLLFSQRKNYSQEEEALMAQATHLADLEFEHLRGKTYAD